MIQPDMAERLNEQLNQEFFSAYFYLALAAHGESLGLRGTAHWFMAKHREEIAHAMKLYRYLLDQGARVELTAVERPPASYEGVVDMFEKTLGHEQAVTSRINNLVGAALSQQDHATHIFLQWFVTEQIEEEAVLNEVLDRLRLFGGKGEGLFLLDNELGGKARAIEQALSQELAASA